MLKLISDFSIFFTFEKLDKGFFEYWGPLGLQKVILKLSNYFKNLQTGNLRDYIKTFAQGVLVLFLITIKYSIWYFLLSNSFYLIG